MEFELTWGGDPEDLLVTVSGRATLDELEGWVQAAVADPRYRDGLRIIVDHRRSQWDDLTTEDIRRRSTQMATADSRATDPPHRIAWVAGRRVDYGVGRMLQGFADEQLPYAFEVFYDDMEQARAWLRKEG